LIRARSRRVHRLEFSSSALSMSLAVNAEITGVRPSRSVKLFFPSTAQPPRLQCDGGHVDRRHRATR
jgi:hypothetical protein